MTTQLFRCYKCGHYEISRYKLIEECYECGDNRVSKISAIAPGVILQEILNAACGMEVDSVIAQVKANIVPEDSK